MANSVMDLLDMLYEMIDDARGGLGGFCKIERDKALDILEEVRGSFPVEIHEARKLMETRDEFLDNARADADRIRREAEADAEQWLKDAKTKADRKVDEHEITATARVQANERMRQAEAKAKEMVATAERRSSELKNVANEYCEDALRRTEEAVTEALDEIRQSRSRFRSLAGMSNVPRPNRNAAYDMDDEME